MGRIYSSVGVVDVSGFICGYGIQALQHYHGLTSTGANCIVFRNRGMPIMVYIGVADITVFLVLMSVVLQVCRVYPGVGITHHSMSVAL